MKKSNNSLINSSTKEVRSIVFILFLALIIRTLIFEPFFIPSSSMKQTLLEGDYVISTKYDYGYNKYSLPFYPEKLSSKRFLLKEPNRGDIVVFRPPHDMKVRYIKRLIGLPGDKIQVRAGQVFINDVAVKQKYLGKYTDEKGTVFNNYQETLPNGVQYSILLVPDQQNFLNKIENTEVFEVPEGHYFFLGDNRDHSLDSRLDLGYVPYENLIAKAKFIFLSTDILLWVKGNGVYNTIKRIIPWLRSIRHNRIFKPLYQSNKEQNVLSDHSKAL